jgi:hypothetical protein
LYPYLPLFQVFTSQHWMMRIYRVRDQPLRDPLSAKAGAVSSGGVPGRKAKAQARRS